MVVLEAVEVAEVSFAVHAPPPVCLAGLRILHRHLMAREVAVCCSTEITVLAFVLGQSHGVDLLASILCEAIRPYWSLWRLSCAPLEGGRCGYGSSKRCGDVSLFPVSMIYATYGERVVVSGLEDDGAS